MKELHGKGWRVLGYLIWMLGAGVALDGTSGHSATLMLAAGAAMFALGVWQSMSGGNGYEGSGGTHRS